MQKDKWDKLAIAGSFLSSTLIVIFTTVVTYYTSKMSSKIDEFKTGIEENKMISELVREMVSDTSKQVKYDLTLLSLERYLRNSTSTGTLKPQDKEMLTGFAQTIILDRKGFYIQQGNRLEIPINILRKYDSLRWMEIQLMFAEKDKSESYPESVETEGFDTIAPVAQLNDPVQLATSEVIVKKLAYIQYSDKKNKEAVTNIQQKLQENTWIAPGIEFVEGSMTTQ